MNKHIQDSFRSSGEKRARHLQDQADTGVGADLGRARGDSLEGLKETGENVGSDKTYVDAGRTPAVETKNYRTGDSGALYNKIEQVKAAQAQAREAAKDGGPNDWVMVEDEAAQTPVLSKAEMRKELDARAARLQRAVLDKLMAERAAGDTPDKKRSA